MYVEYEYYAKEYRLDLAAAIPEDFFLFWSKQAEREVDKRTYGCLHGHMELVSDDVKDCVCEIAELLYQADRMSEQTQQQGGAGPLVSYSNDGQSGTFDLSHSIYTEEGKAKKVRDIIYKHLTHTGLLYAGVR